MLNINKMFYYVLTQHQYTCIIMNTLVFGYMFRNVFTIIYYYILRLC
jgi:hypothetical protein